MHQQAYYNRYQFSFWFGWTTLSLHFALLAVTTSTLAITVSSAKAPVVVISTGLRNLGNTCYLNAQLQCAFHIPKVRELIRTDSLLPEQVLPTLQSEDDHETESDRNSSNNNNSETREQSQEKLTPSSPTRQPVQQRQSPGLQALRLVFEEMTHEAVADRRRQPVDPRVLAVTLGIPVMEQQDSQEFWKLLLPVLNVPALTKLYQGTFEDYIVALDGSNRERRRNEPFLDLSLDLSTSSSVDESLQKMFGKPELLSVAEGNGWRPEKGADKVDAQKGSQLLVKGLPPILQLHLKRFNFDWNRNVMEKLNNPLSFPLELNLGPLLLQSNKANNDENENDKYGSSVMYDLQAVVVHAGEFGVGHYYAYVRPNLPDDEGIWYRFNDDHVTQVSFQDVVQDATGGPVKTGVADNSRATKKRRGLWGRIYEIFDKPSFGFGGRTSNAYVLQYVRRSAIPLLYMHEDSDE